MTRRVEVRCLSVTQQVPARQFDQYITRSQPTHVETVTGNLGESLDIETVRNRRRPSGHFPRILFPLRKSPGGNPLWVVRVSTRLVGRIRSGVRISAVFFLQIFALRMVLNS